MNENFETLNEVDNLNRKVDQLIDDNKRLSAEVQELKEENKQMRKEKDAIFKAWLEFQIRMEKAKDPKSNDPKMIQYRRNTK